MKAYLTNAPRDVACRDCLGVVRKGDPVLRTKASFRGRTEYVHPDPADCEAHREKRRKQREKSHE